MSDIAKGCWSFSEMYVLTVHISLIGEKVWLPVILVEHMAEWLRHWTRDLGVWGSIPAAPVMCKSVGQALNPHCPPSSNGYQVERKLVLCEWLQLQKIVLHSPQGNETVKEWVPIPGDKWCKVRWTCLRRYLDYKHAPLPLPLYWYTDSDDIFQFIYLSIYICLNVYVYFDICFYYVFK